MAGGAAAPLVVSGNPFKQTIVQKGYYLAYALVTSLFFSWGFAYGLIDVLNKHTQEVLDVTRLQSTGLQVMYFGLGYFAFSNVAGEVLKRKSYKFTIIMGLTLYALGAVFFWPVAKFASPDNKKATFGGLLICTGVIACGLATLEVAANSYVTVMPPVGPAAFRLQFSQSWNGLASFIGPLIASKFFFTAGNSDNLTNVQYVYLAVAAWATLLIVAFYFVHLPEVSEADLQETADNLSEAAQRQLAKPFYKQVRPIFGLAAQWFYVAAQVAIGALFINNAVQNGGYSDSEASSLLSYALIIFTVGRFVASGVLTVASGPFVLVVCSTLCTLFTALGASLHGVGGVVSIMIVYFFMAPMYPIIFVTGTENLGHHSRRAASILVIGVSGGAVYPPAQAAIADAFNDRVSFWLNVPAFLIVSTFGVYIWRQKGYTFTVASESRHVASQFLGTHVESASVEDEKKGDLAEMDHIEKL